MENDPKKGGMLPKALSHHHDSCKRHHALPKHGKLAPFSFPKPHLEKKL